MGIIVAITVWFFIFSNLAAMTTMIGCPDWFWSKRKTMGHYIVYIFGSPAILMMFFCAFIAYYLAKFIEWEIK